MLKVLQLIPSLDRSGAEKQVALLARHLPRSRFQVEVAALTRLGPIEADLREAGVPVTLIGKRHKLDPLALARLVRFLKAGRFDVVQTWIFAANAYGRVAARRAGVPVVVATEVAVDVWKSRAYLEMDRRLIPWTDCVLAVSEAVAAFYRKVGYPADLIEVIPTMIADAEPPTVDPAEVRPGLGLAADAPLVLFVGRLAEQKGVGDLIAALDLLQHVRPDLRTLIVGDGPLRARLERTASAFQLGERVKFLGHRNDVPRLLAAADMLVLPSLYEGMPNVVLEAMWSRKPVVATAAPGTDEAVVDGQTGLLVPIGTPPALAQAIRTVLQDPDLARRLGEAGRARVESEFAAGPLIDRFADLFERLARRKGLMV